MFPGTQPKIDVKRCYGNQSSLTNVYKDMSVENPANIQTEIWMSLVRPLTNFGNLEYIY